jgi:hypothetical protein
MTAGRFASFGLFSIFLVSACDLDQLGCSIGKMPHGYGLQRWEDGKLYYLLGPNEKPGGGVLEGTVAEIGWNDRFIIANRHANFGGDPGGWMIIDTEAKKITGPVPKTQLQSRHELKDIVIFPASAAWKRLPRCQSPRLANRAGT